MSHLTLVRHGQASMFADNYDKLSEIGELQSRRLAEYWVKNEVTFEEVFVGPRERQRRTEELVRSVYREANLAWPTAIVIEELDEYDGDGILKEFLPVLREGDERIRRLAEASDSFYGTAERYKHFQRMFEAVTGKWLEGAHESEKVESWKVFHDRVTGALRHIVSSSESNGRRIAVFTSGGPISIAVQTAVKAPEATALELNWRVRNCSLTEIVFTRDRMTLDAFNLIPHLTEPELLTYR